jgi:hypothetical protein
MRKILTITAITLIAVSAPRSGLAQSATLVDQLVASLSGGDQRAREEAVSYIRKKIQPADRSAELEQALANELVRLNTLGRARMELDRAGKPIPDSFPADHLREVIALVSESPRPLVLPALLGAIGTGGMVKDALVRFGDEAVPGVISVARAKVGLVTTGSPGDTPPPEVADAINVLRELLGKTTKPVSAQSRVAILAVARDRLTGPQDVVVAMAACRLAVATRDQTLRARVSALAENRNEVASLGIVDPRFADNLQRVAKDALAVR